MNPSGVAPPVNVRGWEPIFIEDFNTPTERGDFIGNALYQKWSAYPSGARTSSPWKAGRYDNSILEVVDSCLVLNVHTDDAGHALTAALRPKLSSTAPWGVTALRQSIRFRCDPLPGYKLAWMLWPDAEIVGEPSNWPEDGEIDFPECGLALGDTIHGFVHREGASGPDGGSDQWAVNTKVEAAAGEWHTATINWKPGMWRTAMCEFVLDGISIGKWTQRIPDGPMHSVIQTEPLPQWAKPDKRVAGSIWIDWYVAYHPA